MRAGVGQQGCSPWGVAPLWPPPCSAPARCLTPGLPAWFFGVFWGRNSHGLVISFAESESKSGLGWKLVVGVYVCLAK